MNDNIIPFGRPTDGEQGGPRGGGRGGGLEVRVALLEGSVSHLERDVQEIRLDIREMRFDLRDVRDRVGKLEERVSHLPGKGYVVTVVILAVALMTAVVTFQNNIQRLVGAAPSAATVTTSQ